MKVSHGQENYSCETAQAFYPIHTSEEIPEAGTKNGPGQTAPKIPAEIGFRGWSSWFHGTLTIQVFFLPRTGDFMNSIKRREEFLILLLCVLVVALYSLGVLYDSRWTGFLTPILAVLLIGGFLRLRTYWYLKRLNGEYQHYHLDNKLIDDRKTTIKYDFCNLLRIRPVLFANQVSESKGNWESRLAVSELNPFLSFGFFKYTKSGRPVRGESRGGQEGDWGTHKFHINREEGEIHVKTISKTAGRSGSGEYYLKKVTKGAK